MTTVDKWEPIYVVRSVSAELRVPHGRGRWAESFTEDGPVATIVELAEGESIAPSHMTRVVRLTLLAPDIVGAILDGGQGQKVKLTCALAGVPAKWSHLPAAFRS
jgi:hypothetical protein